MSTAEMYVITPDGETTLPLLRMPPFDLRLVNGGGATLQSAVSGANTIDLSGIALDRTTLVCMVGQLYATQKDLAQPPFDARGDLDSQALERWFEGIVQHAESEPADDPWVEFLADAIEHDVMGPKVAE